jgi:hypothetical protein
MLELIQKSQVPSNLMQSAARGSLSVSPEEMIEILVYLSLHHKILGAQARLTLAGWDEKACAAVAGNPATSAEVLGYFAALENIRIQLLPALTENPAVSEQALSALASQGTRSSVEAMLASARVMKSPGLLKALQSNPNLRPNELASINAEVASLETGGGAVFWGEDDGTHEPEVVEALNTYLKENAAELAAEKDKPFRPLGGMHDEGSTTAPETPVPTVPVAVDATPVAAPTATSTTTPAAAHPKKHAPPGSEQRDSTLMKIAKLNIQGRIALAMRGTKEERSILIRDSTKLVCLAVLDSPKVSDGEVEKFALQKNVLEAVLRAIPMKRKFAKNYSIMRNLVFNPRTPMDVALGLMKNLLVHDLKNLSGNKEVSETIRKLALRMFKQKVEKKD